MSISFKFICMISMINALPQKLEGIIIFHQPAISWNVGSPCLQGFAVICSLNPLVGTTSRDFHLILRPGSCIYSSWWWLMNSTMQCYIVWQCVIIVFVTIRSDYTDVPLQIFHGTSYLKQLRQWTLMRHAESSPAPCHILGKTQMPHWAPTVYLSNAQWRERKGQPNQTFPSQEGGKLCCTVQPVQRMLAELAEHTWILLCAFSGDIS